MTLTEGLLLYLAILGSIGVLLKAYQLLFFEPNN